jgi:hypothetical protein
MSKCFFLATASIPFLYNPPKAVSKCHNTNPGQYGITGCYHAAPMKNLLRS